MKYGVIWERIFNKEDITTFSVFATLREASDHVSKNGGYVVRLVETVEKETKEEK